MSRRPLPPLEGADLPDESATEIPGGLPLDGASMDAEGNILDTAPAAAVAPGVVLNDTIEAAPAAATPPAEPDESGAPTPEQDETPRKGRKTGAAKTRAQTRTGAARGSTPSKARTGRQNGTQRRAEATRPEAEATPTAPAPPSTPYAGYVERGAPVPFTPPAAAVIPERIVRSARAIGMRWVSVNMRALEVRREFDQACDEVRALAAALGLPAEAAEAALLDMGAAIGAPIAAPPEAGDPADA